MAHPLRQLGRDVLDGSHDRTACAARSAPCGWTILVPLDSLEVTE
jgi:hypothetical protein